MITIEVNTHQHPPFFADKLLNFFILLIIATLSSCALIGHKTPSQKTLSAGLKSVYTLDVFADKKVLHTLLSGIDSNSKHITLKYLRSTDSGTTWSAPVTVNQDLAPVKKSKRGNDFQLAASDNKIMAIWQTKGAEPWTGKLAVALSVDFGQSWQQIASPVDDQYAAIDQGYLDLTADSLGNFHIAWLDDREEAGNTQGLRYARFNNQNNAWDYHQTLEATVCTCCWASITTDTSNQVHILYRDDSPRDMRLISSLNGGQSWQGSQPTADFGWEFVGCPHQGGGLITTTTAEKTTLHSIIWNGKAATRGVYYSQSELNKDKIASLQSLGDSFSASADIAAINSQHLRTVYTAGGFDSKSVVTRSSFDGGQSWSAEQQLTNEKAEPSHPRIVATTEGFRFFWTEWQKNGDAIAIISELK